MSASRYSGIGFTECRVCGDCHTPGHQPCTDCLADIHGEATA